MKRIALLTAIALAGTGISLAPSSQPYGLAVATGQSCLDAHGQEAPTVNGDGDYVIDSAKKLVFLSENVTEVVPMPGAGKWLEQSFLQTEPIDLQECLFTPIGTDEDDELFVGEYNGQGKAIASLRTEGDYNNGLFGATEGAHIEAVILENVSINVTGGGYSGALVGTAYNGTEILRASATGIVAGSGEAVGGLVGYLSDSSIGQSWSSVAVTGEGNSTEFGGLVGSLYTSNEKSSLVVDSYATGPVIAQSTAGGLVGGASANGARSGNPLVGIFDSYSTGTVTESNPDNTAIRVDGLIGAVAGALLTSGAINFDELDLTGSFWLDSDNIIRTVEYSPSPPQIIQILVSDLKGFVEENWSVEDGWSDPTDENAPIWGIRADLNDGYPFLLWQFNTEPEPGCGPLSDDGFHQVSTPEQLRAVGIRGEESPCGLGDNYRQVNNIDLAGTGPWTPIGGFDLGSGEVNGFTGHYDGGDYTISNMSIESQGTLVNPPMNPTVRIPEPVGFFGFIDGARVERLTFDNASIGLSGTLEQGAREAVGVSGILAGAATGATIENVHVSGADLTAIDFISGGLVGGILDVGGGEAETEITDCSVEVTVRSVQDAELAFGGIVGVVSPNASLFLGSCDVTVDVEVTLAATNQFEDLDLLLGTESDNEPPSNGSTDGGGGLNGTIDDITADDDGPPPLNGLIGGAVGAVAIDGTLFLQQVTLTGDSTIKVIHDEDGGLDFEDFTQSAVGGLVGYSLGLLGIEESHVGSGPHLASSPSISRVEITISGSDTFLLAGGLVGGGIPAPGENSVSGVVESSATTLITLDARRIFGAVGGLIGVSQFLLVADNVTDAEMAIDVTEESQMWAGGLIGVATDTVVEGATVTTDMTVEASSGDTSAAGLIGRAVSSFVDDVSVTSILVMTAVDEALVHMGGIVASAEKSEIENSLADVTMLIDANEAGVLAGGLFGGATDSPIELSSAHVEIDITTNEAEVLAGGLVGVFEQDNTSVPYFIRYSSSSGTITVNDMSEGPEESGVVVAGLVAVAEVSSAINNSWSNVDIDINSLGQDSEIYAGGAFGYIFEEALVTNILSGGAITLGDSVSSRQSPELTVGNFASVVGESFGGPNQFTNNFARAGRALVGDGPDDGIAPLSDAEITTITPYREAGWGIVPATASTVPAGPEDEVWVIASSGLCAPVLWWQWDTVKDGCFADPATSGGGDNHTNNNASGSGRPGNTRPTAPLEEAGQDQPPVFLRPFTAPPSTEDADQLEQPAQLTDAETDADADTAGGDDTASGESASDNGVAGQPSAGLSTGALWAIGLGGVGAVALIAGGIAFARMRP